MLGEPDASSLANASALADATALGDAAALADAAALTDATGATVFGWLLLIAMVLSAAGILPLVARVLRTRLPERPRGRTSLPPLRLGSSEKARRSPRHAVAAHRSFLTGTFTAAIGLVLLALMPALAELGRAGVVVAFLFVAPTLLVAWHSRRRDFRTAEPGDPMRETEGRSDS